ncbi:hypothetical protein ACE1ET_08895 [Saccharicrinis sp. FJH62]|uniref:hypothetical protein n=1 Tax=Saccharicrinis sp. FJH62 TaxID=3344657 RepID=UPI0035D4B1A6
MKRIQFILISILVLLAACNGGRSQNTTENGAATEQFGLDAKTEKTGWFSGSNKKQIHEFKDARTGLVVYTEEFPSAWQVISKPSYTMDQKLPVFLMQIQGPDNLKVFNTPIKMYFTYDNQQMNQYLMNSGMSQMVSPEASNQQILQYEVQGRMQKSGFVYQGERNIPELNNFIQGKINEMNIPNFYFKILNTEWTNNKGEKALVIISKYILKQPDPFMGGSTVWYYSTEYLFSRESVYENAVTQLTGSAISMKENPKWVQYRNLLTQQRIQESMRQHQANMQSRQAAFDAHQRKMKGIYAAQDANYKSFMNRNFGSGSDNSQHQFLNMINEQETVYNPATGNNYQVDAGSTEYWMDSQGNYIQNDDLFYNPNGDINLNDREWTKAQIVP